MAPVHDGGMTLRLNDLAWPVRTVRLTIRPAVPTDVDATWQFRRLPSVGRWITSCPSGVGEYRTRFEDPDRMAATLVIELDGAVIGDLMLAIQDAWAQSEVKHMRREQHTIRDSLHRSGQWLDGLGYALLAGEWWGRQNDR